MPISLNPNTFVSGGLLNDADVEIVEARYVLFDYQGTVDANNTRTALRLQMRTLDGTQEATEHLTLGSTTDFIPNTKDGGLTLDSLSGKTSLGRRSKLFFFLQSLADAGADVSRLDSGRADELEGLKIHIVRKPMPDLGGLEITRRGKNQDQHIEYLHVTKLIDWPKKSEAKPQQQAQQQQQPQVSDSEAKNLAMDMLYKLGKPGMPVRRLAMEAMKASAGLSPQMRNQVARLLANEAFLSECAVLVENGVITDMVGSASEEEIPF